VEHGASNSGAKGPMAQVCRPTASQGVLQTKGCTLLARPACHSAGGLWSTSLPPEGLEPRVQVWHPSAIARGLATQGGNWQACPACLLAVNTLWSRMAACLGQEALWQRSATKPHLQEVLQAKRGSWRCVQHSTWRGEACGPGLHRLGQGPGVHMVHQTAPARGSPGQGEHVAGEASTALREYAACFSTRAGTFWAGCHNRCARGWSKAC